MADSTLSRTGVACALLAALLGACSDPAAPEPELGEVGRWRALGEGLTGSASVFIELDGDLVAGGTFRTAGDQPARNIALWDGALWHPLGTGLDGPAQALSVHEDGLVVAGWFGESTSRVLRWDGAEWQALGHLQDTGIMRLAVHDGSLYAGGNGLARWDGSEWRTVQVEVDGEVHTGRAPFVAHGGDLIVGAGPDRLARWDGSAWTWMDRPPQLFDLVAGGGELFAPPYLRWDGSQWEVLPPVPGLVTSWGLHVGSPVLGVHGFPSGELLRWDGSEWRAVGGAVDDRVRGIGSFGPELVVGGDFTSIDGEPFRGIASLLPDWATGPGGGG